jgi:hypothetical protein
MSLHAVFVSLFIAHASRPISRGSVSLLFALIKDELLSPSAHEGI